MSAPVLRPGIRGHDDAPEQRGRLEVSDTAVERIAQAAAAEINSVLDQPGRVFGGSGRGVRAHADVDGTVARVRVGVTLRYPVSVPRACDQIRDRVVRRLHEYAGISVVRCDIQVAELLAERQERRVR